MFRAKICGLTRAHDVALACSAGADALGFNFYAPGKRYVSPVDACRLSSHVPAGVIKVGVFVNSSAADLVSISEQVKLDAIQIHGDEPPEFLAELASQTPLPLIQALRLGLDGLTPIIAYFAELRRLGVELAAVLIDAHSPGQYGGSGQTVDWSLLAGSDREAWLNGTPLILAGGLTSDNVGLAIAAVRPDGVDTASGVESAPGIKDAAKMAAFVRAAREAW